MRADLEFVRMLRCALRRVLRRIRFVRAEMEELVPCPRCALRGKVAILTFVATPAEMKFVPLLRVVLLVLVNFCVQTKFVDHQEVEEDEFFFRSSVPGRFG